MGLGSVQRVEDCTDEGTKTCSREEVCQKSKLIQRFWQGVPQVITTPKEDYVARTIPHQNCRQSTKHKLLLEVFGKEVKYDFNNVFGRAVPARVFTILDIIQNSGQI